MQQHTDRHALKRFMASDGAHPRPVWRARPHIHSRTRWRVHARLLSVAAVLLLTQGFGVKFKSAIALIINYLGSPFGWAFTERCVG